MFVTAVAALKTSLDSAAEIAFDCAVEIALDNPTISAVSNSSTKVLISTKVSNAPSASATIASILNFCTFAAPKAS